MAITKWKKEDRNDPWFEFRNLQNEINDLFEINRYPSSTGLFDRSVSPAMDVIERDHDLYLTCELPGMEEKDIDVTIASNVLTIKGTKQEEKQEERGKYYRKESWSGSFQRTIPLPASLDTDKVEAELTDGILYITLQRKEEAKPKQVSVKVK